MTPKEILLEIRESYISSVPLFNKDDENYQCLKDYRFGRLHGIFTPDYHKRKRLFKEGIITYAYVFKSYQNKMDEDQDYPIWLIISPSTKYIDNPHLYEEVVCQLNQFMTDRPKKNKEKKLLNILLGELSEPKYIELPKELTNGDLVYLSSGYVRHTHTQDFRMGLNVVLYGLSFTKEIMLLPDRYLSLTWKNYKNQKGSY